MKESFRFIGFLLKWQKRDETENMTPVSCSNLYSLRTSVSIYSFHNYFFITLISKTLIDIFFFYIFLEFELL